MVAETVGLHSPKLQKPKSLNSETRSRPMARSVKTTSLAILLTIFCLLLFSNLVFLAYSSGGSKVTTFHYNGGFGPRLFDVDVHFSWDSDTWLLNENHEVGFTIEIKNINPDVDNLTLSVNKVYVRLKSQDLYHDTEEILSQDLSNQITTLVWLQFKTLILNNPQSFSYTVRAPEPYQSVSKDESVKLYYMIDIVGNYHFKGSSEEGSGSIGGGPFLSNEGGIFGGVEDPVWITIKGVPPQFPWIYVAIGIVIVICASAITTALIIRRNRLKKRTVTTPPPPSPLSTRYSGFSHFYQPRRIENES